MSKLDELLAPVAPTCQKCARQMTCPCLLPESYCGRLMYRANFECDCGMVLAQDIAIEMLEDLRHKHEASHPKVEAEPPPRVINGSVLGYRAWRIKDWRLVGSHSDAVWTPGVNEAKCGTGRSGDLLTSAYITMWEGPTEPHAAPHEGCACGITALARFARKDRDWGNDDTHLVYGAIEAWGESQDDICVAEIGDVADAAGVVTRENDENPGFILHGTGFRSRFGKIVLLAIDESWPTAKKAAIRALAAEHGADVCRWDHLEDAAKEHGQLVPDEMLEWVTENEEPEIPSLGGQSAYLSSAIQSATLSINSSLWPSSPPKFSKKAEKRSKRGIAQTIGHPGPPSHGQFKQGMRVKDSKGAIWLCARGGKPGSWEAQES
jgi:hypothetical protein